MEHYLEDLDRLSRSQIWELQKAYYMRQGMDAWNEGFIPSFMSSSAFVAQTYADLIEGFIRDCNSDAPVTIVELGAGSGRLAFLILRSLFDRSIESNRYRYVMTDFTESNVNAWGETEVFQPFIDAGVLTFRVFDADSPEIMAGGEAMVLDPGPRIVIANYVVDTLRQDAFRREDSDLLECQIAAYTENPSRSEDVSIADIKLQRHLAPVSFPYYDDAVQDAVLRDYANDPGKFSFQIPVGFLDCLKYFSSLGTPFLALVGDKGRINLVDFQSTDAELVLHDGCFSFSANFHALARFAAHSGGEMLMTDDIDRGFIVTALLLHEPDAGACETRRAFAQGPAHFSPRDLYRHINGILDKPDVADALDIIDILSLLKLSHYETRVFLKSRKPLIRCLRAAKPSDRRAVSKILERVRNTHYPLGISQDFPYALGQVFDQLNEPEKARACYEDSLNQKGPHRSTLYRLARCHEDLKDFDGARAHVQDCLRIQPGYEKAQRLLERLKIRS